MEFIVAGLRELVVQAPFDEAEAELLMGWMLQIQIMMRPKGGQSRKMRTVEMAQITWWNDCA